MGVLILLGLAGLAIVGLAAHRHRRTTATSVCLAHNPGYSVPAPSKGAGSKPGAGAGGDLEAGDLFAALGTAARAARHAPAASNMYDTVAMHADAKAIGSDCVGSTSISTPKLAAADMDYRRIVVVQTTGNITRPTTDHVPEDDNFDDNAEIVDDDDVDVEIDIDC